MRLLTGYEPARLEALERLGIVGGGNEPPFNRLVELARRSFDSSISAINFVDARRAWCKAISGWSPRSMPRAATFCNLVIDGDDVFEVADALLDDRFSELPIVRSGPRVRFYAGAPIKDARGYGVGTFCIFDIRPRRLEDGQRESLRGFASLTGELIELRRRARTQPGSVDETPKSDRLLALFRSVLSAVSEAADLPSALALAAERIAQVTGWRARGVWRPGAWLEGELPARASLERRPVLSQFPSTAAIPVLAGDDVVGVLSFNLAQQPEALPQVAAVVQQVGGLVRRRRVEDALRASEQKLRSVMETARDGIITLARDGTIVYANPAARLLFGRDELRGLPLERLIPSWSDALDHIRKGGPNMIERWAVHRSWKQFPVEISCAEWTMERSGYVTAIVRDVTERQQARLERAAAERRLQFLFRVTSELLEQPLSTESLLDTMTRLLLPQLGDWCIVDLLDHSGRGEQLRRVACAPGVASSDSVNIDACEAFASDGQDSLVARVLDGGAPLLISPDLDGSGPWQGLAGFRACIIVPLIARGHTVGAISLVSFARRYSRDDLALATELAHRLALALDNAKLYDEARRAVRVRDDVLAIVSHDLRNPLSTILTSTERLLMRDPEDARQSIARCRRAAQRMTRMISDLVDAASLDSGTLSLDRRDHDLLRVVNDAIDLLQPLAEARGLTLAAGANAELSAFCDRERVVQVLSNLVGNAIKFSPAESTIRIAAELWGSMVRISVSDGGPGITPDLLPRIFDRYWHTNNAHNRQGAGLGLYIAKGIVEGHGGRIWVDSVPGRGSTFYFTLPTSSARVAQVAN